LATKQGLPKHVQEELIKLGMEHIISALQPDQPDPKPDDEAKCAICLQELESCRAGFKNVVFTPCGHPFHPQCINRLQKKECPVCRASLTENEIHALHAEAQVAVDREIERDNEAFEAVQHENV
jgi:hypothetical protein